MVERLWPRALMPAWMQARTEPWRLENGIRVPWLIGACIASPRNVLRDTGPFDESIELHSEDLELRLGASRRGIPSHFKAALRPERLVCFCSMETVYDLRPQIEGLPTRQRTHFPELTDDVFWRLYEQAKPYSMLHVPGFYNLFQSIRYIAASNIPGALVECGVFLGGAAIFASLTCEHFGLDRLVYGFDTFAGFPEGQTDRKTTGELVRGPAYQSFLAAVERNVQHTGAEVLLVEGDVTETIPKTETGLIGLLRLDTDYYESTHVELEHLYPRLVPGGVLIVDDYGLYQGARRATDEYLAELDRLPLLFRITNGIWAGTKP